MATRCQIAFYQNKDEKDLTKYEALIYRHWDGYPEGVLPDIVPILREFYQGRGLKDIEYASAYLVAKLKTDMLNIGISNCFHSDIEYVYAVYPDAIIDVYEVDWTNADCYDKPIEQRLTKIKTVSLLSHKKTTAS